MSDTPTIFSTHQAAKEGNTLLLKKASKKDLNREDEDGWTPVHWAAWNGSVEALKMVLSKGGDADRIDGKGNTPLHTAAIYGHQGALELLVSHGANLYSLDIFGRTAAKVAAYYQKADCCRYLDTLAVRWEVQNPEYVQKMQLKAMKELKKRSKALAEQGEVPGAQKPRKTSYDYATAPSGRSPAVGDKRFTSTSTHALPTADYPKKKVSQQEALRQNFELRPSHSTDYITSASGNFDPKESGFSHSAGNTFRPVPRVGPLLNTLQSLAHKPNNPSQLSSNYQQQEPGFYSHPGSGGAQQGGHHGAKENKGGLLELVPIQPFQVENDSALATFLNSLDLMDCIQVLHKEKLDLDALALCNEKDLISISIPLGPRKKILNAIQRRKQLLAGGSGGTMTDSDL